jgi:hypothetical protein
VNHAFEGIWGLACLACMGRSVSYELRGLQGNSGILPPATMAFRSLVVRRKVASFTNEAVPNSFSVLLQVEELLMNVLVDISLRNL